MRSLRCLAKYIPYNIRALPVKQPFRYLPTSRMTSVGWREKRPNKNISDSIETEINEIEQTSLPLQEALQLINIASISGLPITVTLGLNIDLSRTALRGQCTLPYPAGDVPRILALCPDEDASVMIATGAQQAGISLPLEHIRSGKINFDLIFAVPEIMPQVLQVARILGPLKLMPNPKSGTLVRNIREAVKLAAKGAQIQLRAEVTERGPILSAIIGKTGQDYKQLHENISELIKSTISLGGSTSTNQNKFQENPSREALKHIPQQKESTSSLINQINISAPGIPAIIVSNTL